MVLVLNLGENLISELLALNSIHQFLDLDLGVGLGQGGLDYSPAGNTQLVE